VCVVSGNQITIITTITIITITNISKIQIGINSPQQRIVRLSCESSIAIICSNTTNHHSMSSLTSANDWNETGDLPPSKQVFLRDQRLLAVKDDQSLWLLRLMWWWLLWLVVSCHGLLFAFLQFLHRGNLSDRDVSWLVDVLVGWLIELCWLVGDGTIRWQYEGAISHLFSKMVTNSSVELSELLSWMVPQLKQS
jgi:hypothetical protein